MDFSELVQLLGAVGVGGIVVQYLSRSAERRQARGQVREALSEVERLRWTFDLRVDDWREFRGALRSFVSAALVAGMPRRLVDRYERMAQVSRSVTARMLKAQNVTSADQVTINAELSECIERTHELVADYLWRPVRSRLLLKRGLKKLDALEEEAQQTEYGRALRHKYWPP